MFRGCKQTKCPFFRTCALKNVPHAPNAYNGPLLLCSRCLHPLFQNRYPFILLPSLFQPPSHDQQKSRQSVNYHSSPSGLTSRIHPLLFLQTPRDLTLSRNFVESQKLVTITLLKNGFASQKIKSRHFQSCTLPK